MKSNPTSIWTGKAFKQHLREHRQQDTRRHYSAESEQCQNVKPAVCFLTWSIWLPSPSLSLYGRMTPSSWMKRGGRRDSTSCDVSAALQWRQDTLDWDTGAGRMQEPFGYISIYLKHLCTYARAHTSSTYLLIPWKVLLAMSMMPPVGRATAPTRPFPKPLKKPAAPSRWAPAAQC